MEQQKQIFVLQNESLLSTSLASLLSSQPHYDVSTMSIEEIAQADRADLGAACVIVFEAELLMANLAALIDLVTRHAHVRLIVIPVEDNELHVFEKRTLPISDITDFLNVL